ncbi:contact-dependent growth inhibition system immunity protein [Luteimonas arsenica]|uniref:contact-dependent growth inhibition system immunity protein n=1 Tax=Luteimonas arsenica TaxID=1586242 RepID=UPI0010545A20|nr:contact-dependent growth inhibition system immunity protein [Luteimonas arsenica]
MSDTPALENFLSAYFHQDWAMEHDTADGVVAAYLDSEADAEIVAVRDDLARIAAEGLDEATLGARLQGLGSEYDPTRDGGSWQGWLAALQAAFAR